MKVYVRRYRVRGEGLTQQRLADLTGVTRQTIISIEKGRYKPSVELALCIAGVLSTTVEELFSLEPGHLLRKRDGTAQGQIT